MILLLIADVLKMGQCNSSYYNKKSIILVFKTNDFDIV